VAALAVLHIAALTVAASPTRGAMAPRLSIIFRMDGLYIFD
jgi:hypothetical protein